jgi:hypothetical protein
MENLNSKQLTSKDNIPAKDIRFNFNINANEYNKIQNDVKPEQDHLLWI